MKPTEVDAVSLFAEPPPVNPAATGAVTDPAKRDAPAVSTGRTDPGPAGPATGTDPATGGPTGAGPTGATITEATMTDGAGVPFDPIRHLPVRHPKTDRWMPRRPPKEATGGSVPPIDTGSVVGTDQPTGEPAPGTPAAAVLAEPGPDVSDVMASLHCQAFYGVAVAFLGDEWLASKEEHKVNVATLAAYYRATGIRPDSPGWALLAQGAAFAGKRFVMPKTQTRLGMLKAWFARLFAQWRGRRRAKDLQSIGS